MEEVTTNKKTRKPAFRLNERQKTIITKAVEQFRADYAEKYGDDTDNPLFNHSEVLGEMDVIIRHFGGK